MAQMPKDETFVGLGLLRGYRGRFVEQKRGERGSV
ncbi:uncharacterized protein G2W53_015565 [Senna tora]|uniref:Uncharacterized protein n=1 Tax=Senna tora TaxID=362788 RepID=A0A834WVW8_9FABA|nr:uncharacterized protein G2W53_015565 [Senna tora]